MDARSLLKAFVLENMRSSPFLPGVSKQPSHAVILLCGPDVARLPPRSTEAIPAAQRGLTFCAPPCASVTSGPSVPRGRLWTSGGRARDTSLMLLQLWLLIPLFKSITV